MTVLIVDIEVYALLQQGLKDRHECEFCSMMKEGVPMEAKGPLEVPLWAYEGQEVHSHVLETVFGGCF